MTGTPPRRYAAVFYGCLLVAVVLAGVMILSERDDRSATSVQSAQSAQPVRTAQPVRPARTSAASSRLVDITLRWTPEQLRTLMQQALDSVTEDAAVTAVTLAAPDTVTVSGTVSRAALERLLDRSDVEGRGTLELALKLLPDTMNVSVAFAASVEDGSLAVSPLSLRAESVTLPASVLPSGVTAAANAAVRRALTEQHCTLETLEIHDDTLLLTCWVSNAQTLPEP